MPVIVGTTLLLASPARRSSALVTVIGPVVAPAGTVAVTAVSVTVPTTAGMPLKATAVVSARLVPLIVTLAPTAPLVGVKLVILGKTVNAFALVACPPGVVTVIRPVVAPAG